MTLVLGVHWFSTFGELRVVVVFFFFARSRTLPAFGAAVVAELWCCLGEFWGVFPAYFAAILGLK